MTQRSWFVGIDWATEEHAACVTDDSGTIVGERTFPHSGDGLAALCGWLLGTTGAPSLASMSVAIEVPHGAVVETLLERRAAVYAINPKQLDRFRDRFTVAGAKDDRRDAHVLADSLRTDGKSFRRLSVGDPLVIQLREWSRLVDDLQEERGRLANRLRQQLLRYYPQMLTLARDVAADSFLQLWAKIPTPAAARTIRASTLTALLRRLRIRRVAAAAVLTAVRVTPLSVAPGTTEAAVAHIRSVSIRLRLLNQQLREARRMLDQLTAQIAQQQTPAQPATVCDVDIVRSAPGVGRTVLATLLAEAAQPLAEHNYQALRTLSGVAPVTKSSGKRSGKRAHIVMRNACSLRLRAAMYHWARVATQRDPKSRAAYAALRARGHSHGRSLRTIADRLLCMLCAMLRTRTVFDLTKRHAA